MSIDTDDGRNDDGGTTKINVQVPIATADATDEEFIRRGYTSRSEAIRDALYGWLNSSMQLSEETLADLQESWAWRGAGETVPLDDTLDRYDVDVDDDQTRVTDIETTSKADGHWPTSTLKHGNES